MSCTCCDNCGAERGADVPRGDFRIWVGTEGLRMDVCIDCLRQIPEYAISLEKLLVEASALLTSVGMTVCVLGDGAVSTDIESGKCQELSNRIQAALLGSE